MYKIILLVPLLLCGCTQMVMNDFFDHIKDMEKIQHERNMELKAQSFYIEGIILQAETIAKDKIIFENVYHYKDGKKSTEKVEKVIEIKSYIVTFQDGREIEFKNTSPTPLKNGDEVKIRYNGLNEIVEVEYLGPLI